MIGTWLAAAALMPACSKDSGPPCELQSTVPWYQPACEAYLVRYPEENRLFVDEILVAYLPLDLVIESSYGGASGKPLTLILGDEIADYRTSLLTFTASLNDIYLEGSFPSGTVQGTVRARVREGDALLDSGLDSAVEAGQFLSEIP